MIPKDAPLTADEQELDEAVARAFERGEISPPSKEERERTRLKWQTALEATTHRRAITLERVALD